MNRSWFSRIAYLISRTIMRPERAVSTVSHYHPVLDVASLLILLGLWIGFLRILTELREVLHGVTSPVELTGRVLAAVIAFGFSLALVGVYAVAVSITAGLLGAKPRLAATFLAYLLTTAVALGVSAVPVAILRMVEVGEEMGVVSSAIIEVGPWIYILLLFYSATVRIHKTVPARAVVYLGLGALPIVLGLTLIWRYLDLPLPIGLV
jgi:hypothetical protein